MFLRYHFNRGGGLERDTEQTMTIFSASCASMMNVLLLECGWNVRLDAEEPRLDSFEGKG